MHESNRAQMLRLRAIVCEQRAGLTTDRKLKKEWEDLAMQWHALASEAAHVGGDDDQIEVA